MRCTFCATGKGGFARNLKAHEIVDQVMTVQERYGTRVSNVGVTRYILSLHCARRYHSSVLCGSHGPGAASAKSLSNYTGNAARS